MSSERHRGQFRLLNFDVFNLKLLARNNLQRESALRADETSVERARSGLHTQRNAKCTRRRTQFRWFYSLNNAKQFCVCGNCEATVLIPASESFLSEIEAFPDTTLF